MSSTRHNDQEETIPRIALLSMFALVVVVLCAVSVARYLGMPTVAKPPVSEVRAQASLYLFGQQSGAVRVLDEHGAVLADLDGEEGGFVSGVARVIERERQKIGADLEAPVHVRWHENNRISIFDPQTSWQADLMGFGADNSRAFAMLVAKATEGN